MVHKPAAPAQKPAPRKRASKKGVPPQTSTTPSDPIAQAEYRRDTLQTEAAINLAIGYVLHSLGVTDIMLSTSGLQVFAASHRVEVEEVPDVGHTYTVRAR